jgi:hypothetical protein
MHTPGPWEFFDDDSFDDYSIEADGRAEVIATVPKDDVDEKEARDTAGLIAKAPELFEALKAFTEYFGDGANLDNGLQEIHTAAQAIITELEED